MLWWWFATFSKLPSVIFDLILLHFFSCLFFLSVSLFLPLIFHIDSDLLILCAWSTYSARNDLSCERVTVSFDKYKKTKNSKILWFFIDLAIFPFKILATLRMPPRNVLASPIYCFQYAVILRISGANIKCKQADKCFELKLNRMCRVFLLRVIYH